MHPDQSQESPPMAGASKTMDEATALAALVAALGPLDHVARVRLLKTVCTFFELDPRELLPDAGIYQRSTTLGSTEPERNSASNPSFSEDRSISPKAFLIEKRPQSDVERIACLAYYLTHYRDQAAFKTLDLSKLNTEAAQIKLSNPTRAVDNAANAHFLIATGQGKKQLSAIGELYVQALPDRVAAREAIADLKRRRSKGKPKAQAGDESGSSQELGEDFENDAEPGGAA